MANIYTAPPVVEPDPDEFAPFDTNRGDGWYKARGFTIKSIDTGQQGYFKSNSVSGVSSMSELQDSFSERANVGDAAWPMLHLKREQFTAQGFKNFKPIFEVVGWLNTDQLGALVEGADVNELIAEAADVANA